MAELADAPGGGSLASGSYSHQMLHSSNVSIPP
jgi:hypothetical protein